jgi:TRAP transporter TAXI family solute receptor
MSGRSRWALFAGIASLAIALLIGAGFYFARARSADVRIATGLRGGTFLPLGETLARGFAQDVPGVRFHAIESPGSVASLAMLDRGDAELALVSNHVAASESVRLIAVLYEETLQIVVRADAGITTAFDLRGRRVCVGPAASGTEGIADTVLHHYGIADTDFDRRNLTLAEAADALEAGALDAMFVVAGMRTPVVDRLLRRGDMALLSLGDPGTIGGSLEGIRLDAPFFAIGSIPVDAYGRAPTSPVGTITVRALLVARADLDEGVVYGLTTSLFDHKTALANEQQLLAHLTEEFDRSLSPYPLHPGADRYFRRSEPTFLQRYTDQISLALTVGAIIWSALSAWRGARRAVQRGRIEEHLEAAQRIAAEARAASSHAERREKLAALVRERDRAVLELAAERLEANESFVILQQYLGAQIADLERAPLADATTDDDATT